MVDSKGCADITQVMNQKVKINDNVLTSNGLEL